MSFDVLRIGQTPRLHVGIPLQSAKMVTRHCHKIYSKFPVMETWERMIDKIRWKNCRGFSFEAFKSLRFPMFFLIFVMFQANREQAKFQKKHNRSIENDVRYRTSLRICAIQNDPSIQNDCANLWHTERSCNTGGFSVTYYGTGHCVLGLASKDTEQHQPLNVLLALCAFSLKDVPVLNNFVAARMHPRTSGHRTTKHLTNSQHDPNLTLSSALNELISKQCVGPLSHPGDCKRHVIQTRGSDCTDHSQSSCYVLRCKRQFRQQMHEVARGRNSPRMYDVWDDAGQMTPGTTCGCLKPDIVVQLL